MIHFHIDIAYFAQLKRIDAASMELLLSRIDQVLREANGVRVSRHMPLHYSFSDAIPGIRLQVARAAYEVKDILDQAHERITGFNLALDGYRECAPEEAALAFKALVLADGKGNRLLLGRDLLRDFSEFFTIEEEGGSLWVSDFRFLHPVSADTDQSFWLRPSLLGAVQTRVDPWFSGERSGRGLLFLCPRRLGIMRVVERSVAPLLGPDRPPRFRPSENAANPLFCIAARLSQDSLARASSRLDRTERALFESCKPAWEYLRGAPFKALLPAEIVRRFASFLEGFFVGYARDRQSRGLPAPILVEDLDLLPAEAVELISGIFSRFSPSEGLFLLASAEATPRKGLPETGLESVSVDEPPDGEAVAYAAERFPSLAGSQALEGILKRWGGHSLPFYLSLLNGHSSNDPIQVYLKSLPSELLEILFLSFLASPVLSGEDFRDFLASTGRQGQTQEMGLLQLSQMGLILSPDDPEPTAPGLMEKVASAIGDKAETLSACFFSHLCALADRGRIVLSLDLARRASDEGSHPGLPFVLRSLLRERSAGNLAQALGDAGLEALLSREGGDMGETACVKSWSTFLEASDRGERREILARERALQAVHPMDSCRLSGHRSLARSLCARMTGDDKASLAQAKQALMLFQSGPSREDESAALRALGLHFLRQGQVFDAMDYFENALSSADSAGDRHGSALSAYFTAVAFFLHGNASRALRQASRAAEEARAAFRPDWEALSLLLEGRIEFDLGRFDRAGDAWGMGRCVARLSGLTEAMKRFEVMNARLLAARGDADAALAIFAAHPDDAEAVLLSSEALLLASDYDGAREAAEKAMRRHHDAECLFPEAARFDTSYCLAEDLCFGRFPEDGSFGLLALCLRSEACWFQGDWEEAAIGLTRLTRGLSLSDLDPCAQRWWFAAFRCQDESASGLPADLRADRGTLLSKAFKHLQLRASRIDTAEDKHAYMELNPLNRELLDQAKRFKYI